MPQDGFANHPPPRTFLWVPLRLTSLEWSVVKVGPPKRSKEWRCGSREDVSEPPAYTGTFADDVYIATRCPSPDRRGHPVDLPSAAGLASATTFAQPTPTYDGGAALWQNRMPNRWGLTRPHLYERPR